MTALSATQRALADADRIHTPLGQTALLLARRLGSGDTPPSAVGAIARELRLTLAAALEDATMAADPVDELRERRERRQRGA